MDDVYDGDFSHPCFTHPYKARDRNRMLAYISIRANGSEFNTERAKCAAGWRAKET